MPPAGPTPDHPPYAHMIGAAIRALGEEGGSTETSISTYIRANYDGLPFGHDRLLSYYLTKLTNMGEFAVGAPGRYILPPVAASPIPTQSSRLGRAGPSPIKPMNRSGPASKEEDEVPANDGGAAAVSRKRRRGWPRKITAAVSSAEPMDYVLALPAPGREGNIEGSNNSYSQENQ